MGRWFGVAWAVAALLCPCFGQDSDPELDVDRTRVVPPAVMV